MIHTPKNMIKTMIYLISMISIDNNVEAFGHITDGKKNRFVIKMIQYAINQLYRQWLKWKIHFRWQWRLFGILKSILRWNIYVLLIQSIVFVNLIMELLHILLILFIYSIIRTLVFHILPCRNGSKIMIFYITLSRKSHFNGIK